MTDKKAKIMDISIVDGQREYYCAPSCYKCCATSHGGNSAGEVSVFPAEMFGISQALNLPFKDISHKDINSVKSSIRFENGQCYFVDPADGCKLHDGLKPIVCSLFPYYLDVDLYSDDKIIVEVKKLNVDVNHCKKTGINLHLSDDDIRNCAEKLVKNAAVSDADEVGKAVSRYITKHRKNDWDSKNPLIKKISEWLESGKVEVHIPGSSISGIDYDALHELMAESKYKLTQLLTLENAVRFCRKRDIRRVNSSSNWTPEEDRHGGSYGQLLEDRFDFCWDEFFQGSGKNDSIKT